MGVVARAEHVGFRQPESAGERAVRGEALLSENTLLLMNLPADRRLALQRPDGVGPSGEDGGCDDCHWSTKRVTVTLPLLPESTCSNWPI